MILTSIQKCAHGPLQYAHLKCIIIARTASFFCNSGSNVHCYQAAGGWPSTE